MAQCDHLIEREACADCGARETGQRLPVPAGRPDRGPWITASYDGSCAGCGDDIMPGDQIRADGNGGWLCAGCGEADQLVPATHFLREAEGSDFRFEYAPFGTGTGLCVPNPGRPSPGEFLAMRDPEESWYP